MVGSVWFRDCEVHQDQATDLLDRGERGKISDCRPNNLLHLDSIYARDIWTR